MRKFLPATNSSENGQVVLVILLIMSVILVVGLSIASRSVTDIKISQQSQEAARALWVAQAGLEEAIKSNRSIAVGEKEPLSGVEYSVTKTEIGGGKDFVFPTSFEANEPATLSLEGYKGDLTFFWGKQGTSGVTTPALEATLIYKNAEGKYLAKRYVFDPFTGRSPATHFDGQVYTENCSTGDKKFAFCSGKISLPSSITPYFVRLKLLFNDTAHPIGVQGTNDLPSQGSCFDSLATIPESGVSRKLRQCQSYTVAPEIFDYVLFSGGSIQSSP